MNQNVIELQDMCFVIFYNFELCNPIPLNATPLVSSESNFNKIKSSSPILPYQTNVGNDVSIDHKVKTDAYAFDVQQMWFDLEHGDMHHVIKVMKYQSYFRRLPRQMRDDSQQKKNYNKAWDKLASMFKKVKRDNN